jgi:hypothetical protein
MMAVDDQNFHTEFSGSEFQAHKHSVSTYELANMNSGSGRQRPYCPSCAAHHTARKLDFAQLRSLSQVMDLPLIQALCADRSLQPPSLRSCGRGSGVPPPRSPGVPGPGVIAGPGAISAHAVLPPAGHWIPAYAQPEFWVPPHLRYASTPNLDISQFAFVRL